ncbi:glycerophosphodiester phosphodiesterase family protein [Acetatifactor aquisgranensis]|uniref:glycerophosphodiester phosphodiesterase family protein n=1 Tax=Acetatifactor aquisgranensis TaxID=2941233 RepID=UPI00203F8EAB|nr:glycerophosphodiester phosphodiesterase family protein [Acetatifactor aquisgranensis]MCI8542360.1 glycerophosphodiester phosphodiesterase [Lachnospiraceae bacterium]
MIFMILFRILLTALIIIALWCLMLLPRRGQSGWEKLTNTRYAHRGLHDITRGIPENSMAAFRGAVEKGFGSELDVHLMADGQLAVVHDSDLNRVCGKSAIIEELRLEDLSEYPLKGNGETIPLFRDVLALFEEKTPLIIELKVEHGNAAALTDAVMALLKDWKGAYCIESFHPAVLLHLKKHYPSVIRGQLSENFLRVNDAGTLTWPVRAILTLLLTSFLTRPDFIAYNYTDRACPSLRLMKRLYGVHEAGWTIRSKEIMERLERQGVMPIFEGFTP